LLVPNTNTLADSNVPTVTNTPQETETPIPEAPTQTPIPTAAPSDTPFLILPTDSGLDQGENIIATLPAPVSGRGLSTINVLLLIILGIAVVAVVGIIVYIFINQARGGLG
jgi:hypothetical protein